MKKTTKKKAPRVRRCAECKAPALNASVYAARLEDIPDGNTLSIPKNLCGDCLEKIAEEVERFLGDDQ